MWLLNAWPVNSPLLATEVVEAELCSPSSCPPVAAGVDPPSAAGSGLPSVPAPSGVVLSGLSSGRLAGSPGCTRQQTRTLLYRVRCRDEADMRRA